MKVRRKRQIGTVTSYPALDAFRKYITGDSTLDEFRKARATIIIKPIYEEVDVTVPKSLVLLALVVSGAFGCTVATFCVYLVTLYFE